MEKKIKGSASLKKSRGQPAKKNQGVSQLDIYSKLLYPMIYR